VQRLRKSTETRERLLEVAIEVVEARGEAGIHMDELATLAGVTKPTVYRYFVDREGLVVTVQAERYRRSLQYGLNTIIEDAFRSRDADEFVDVLQRWIRSFLSPEGAAQRALRIDVLGSAGARPKLRAAVQTMNEAQAEGVASLIRLAQERGWVPLNFSPVTVGIWITGLLLSRHLTEMTPGAFDHATWDELTLSVVRFLLTGTDPQPEATQ
jgi:AcrR family transcriptional regulator